jgi:hypothetical protein
MVEITTKQLEWIALCSIVALALEAYASAFRLVSQAWAFEQNNT